MPSWVEKMDIPLATANAIFGFSNLALIVGGVLVLTGTIGVFWSGNIRDRFADERARQTEAKTAAAVAEGAKANERNTALKLELERERVERLRLEQRIAPRVMSPDQRAKLVVGLRATGWHEGIVYWHGSGEPETYAKQFSAAFNDAGISTEAHTLGPFIQSAWGVVIVATNGPKAQQLKSIFDDVGINATVAETNDTLGHHDRPTIVVGARLD
jgi:hypothetical protein